MKPINVTGNLLSSDCKYIAQQCNCISTKAAHLSGAIFQAFPYADCYRGRTQPNELGTIDVRGNGQDERYIINMFGQFYPGKVKYQTGKDTTEIRQRAFKKCLEQIEKIEDLESIAFPWGIGCGAAGGNWSLYSQMLSDFAFNVGMESGVEVYIVKLA